MAKRNKQQKRQHRLIAFKVFEDTDEDILDWWEGIEEGQRSDVIREVVREHLARQGGKPYLARKSQPDIASLTDLAQVRDDTTWIREALTDMPAYLERVIQTVAAMQPTGTADARGVTAQPSSSLSAQDKQNREAKMRKRMW